MLVLARKADENVFINVPPSHLPTLVVVKVVQLERNRLRLGFNAPKAVRITRPEKGGPRFGMKEADAND